MDTREQLLDAAESAARSRGYDAFSYADLSKIVGIRKASIHHHFPAQADLALELLQCYRNRFVETLRSIDDSHAAAGTRLRSYLDVYRNALQGGNAVCLCVAFSAARDSFGSAVLSELDRFHGNGIEWFETVFRLGLEDGTIVDTGSPEQEEAATMALVEGAQLMARAAGDLSRFDTAIATLETRLWSQKICPINHPTSR